MSSSPSIFRQSMATMWSSIKFTLLLCLIGFIFVDQTFTLRTLPAMLLTAWGVVFFLGLYHWRNLNVLWFLYAFIGLILPSMCIAYNMSDVSWIVGDKNPFGILILTFTAGGLIFGILYVFVLLGDMPVKLVDRCVSFIALLLQIPYATVGALLYLFPGQFTVWWVLLPVELLILLPTAIKAYSAYVVRD